MSACCWSCWRLRNTWPLLAGQVLPPRLSVFVWAFWPPGSEGFGWLGSLRTYDPYWMLNWKIGESRCYLLVNKCLDTYLNARCLAVKSCLNVWFSNSDCHDKVGLAFNAVRSLFLGAYWPLNQSFWGYFTQFRRFLRTPRRDRFASVFRLLFWVYVSRMDSSWDW